MWYVICVTWAKVVVIRSFIFLLFAWNWMWCSLFNQYFRLLFVWIVHCTKCINIQQLCGLDVKVWARHIDMIKYGFSLFRMKCVRWGLLQLILCYFNQMNIDMQHQCVLFEYSFWNPFRLRLKWWIGKDERHEPMFKKKPFFPLLSRLPVIV